MQIPTKIQHGEKVISTVFEKINGIIDYLNASKLRKSSGIDVRETPSGTVLELVQKSAFAPQAQQIPAVASGLEATVSGGTATVAISGSTALVIKPGANIQISGGTNGEVIFSATGGTDYPVWGDFSYHTLSETWSGNYLDPIILFKSGYLQIRASATSVLNDNNSFYSSVYNSVSVDGVLVWEYERTCSFSGTTSSVVGLEFGDTNTRTVMIPVHSGSTVTASSTDQSIGLTLFYLNT